MSDRNPYPPASPGPDPDGDEGTEVAPAGPHDGARMRRERLAALDALYERGEITASELGEARRRILEPAGERAAIGAGSEPPPSPAVQEPPAVGPPPSRGRRIAGLPVWGAAAIGAVVVAGLAVLALLLLTGGGDEGGEAAADSAYAAQISVPLGQLTSSAIASGKALARITEPSQLQGLHRTAERQVDVVETARRRLSALRIAAEDRRAHRQLIRSAAAQRRFLVQLGRATAGRPSQATLSAANRTRRAAAQAVRSYRTFFVLAPAAPDAITGTDLADTAGLRGAIQAGIAGPGGGDGSPGVALTPLFIDPDAADLSDFCFGPGQRPTAVASLTFSNSRHYSGIVQCGNSAAGPYAADGELRFDTSSLSGRITGVGGTFGIDEASSSQRGATATFVVRYGGRVVCRLTVSWGAPRSCPGLTDRVVADGGILTVEQSVNPARGDRGLWAGVLDPTLIVG